MARTKDSESKSRIVDAMLAELSEGQKPVWKEFGKEALLRLGLSGEDNLNKVIALTRVRYWRFTKGGFTNKYKVSKI
jgi:hypothetical protein